MPISVVKVFTTYRDNSYSEPWRKNVSNSKTGTASLISHEGKRLIITNEHVIRSHTAVHLTVDGSSKKFPAKVVFSNASCDLALLEITSEYEVFEKLVVYLPLALNIPKLSVKLSTHGFPTGGQTYCVTEGSVSRVESAPYIDYGVDLLRIQISAPINSGSSGGIAVMEHEDKILGITSSGINARQNIGYIIPSLVIEKFINQHLRFKNLPLRTRVTFPGFSVHLQPLQHKNLRNHYELAGISSADSAEELGVLVSGIPETSIYNKIFQVNDIILAVDEHSVRSDGKINFENAEISIQAYIGITKNLGDETKFEVRRKIWKSDKEAFEIEQASISLRLNQFYDETGVYSYEPNRPVNYYVHTDGAIFIVPNHSFITHFDKNFQGISVPFTTKRPMCLHRQIGDTKSEHTKQIVYLSNILETSESLGVTSKSGIVESVDGVKIHNLLQLVEILEIAKKPVALKLEKNVTLILSPNSAKKEKEFCDKNGIQHRMTPLMNKLLDIQQSQNKLNAQVMKQIGIFGATLKDNESLLPSNIRESAHTNGQSSL